jgi:hypothetical protein
MHSLGVGHSEIIVVSPIQDKSYNSNDVWLNFTVTKPSDWFDLGGQMKFVRYIVDGGPRDSMEENAARERLMSWDGGEGVMQTEVQDPLGIANPPSTFTFSFKLAGLATGEHCVDVYVAGNVPINGTVYRVETMLTPPVYFIVYGESSQTSTPIPSTSPTSTPIPSASPEASSESATFPAALVFGASAGIALTALFLIVHFKKYREGKNP